MTNMTLISLGSNLGAKKQHEPDVAMNPHGGMKACLTHFCGGHLPACLVRLEGMEMDFLKVCGTIVELLEKRKALDHLEGRVGRVHPMGTWHSFDD